MTTQKLINALKNIFEPFEIELVNKTRLDLILKIEEIHDINSFIQDCKLETKNKKKAGPDRISDWEKGWSGNGVYYSDDDYNNLPFYFKNNTHIRLGSRIFKDNKGFAEVDLLRALQEIIFKKYLSNFDSLSICEYGCGTGSNIQFLKNLFPNFIFYGSDWTSSACKMLIKNKILLSENIFLTNFFDPNSYKSPDNEFIAFTNASLEQSGDDYKNFMIFLFNNRNCIGGIHIEPIKELLDLKLEINKQSYEYMKNRGYLNNFHKFMLKEESIEILIAKDYGLGSKYINGYQVLCWKKKI